MRWTAYDSRTAARAALAAVVMLAVTWVVTASTDEGGLTVAARAARVLPLAPACAALGTWLAMARGRARGEVHALEALGQSPWQCAAPAICGASAVALLCAASVLTVRAIDVRGFFPAAPHAGGYHFDDGAFVDTAGGVRVERNGDITLLPATADTRSLRGTTPVPHAPPGGRQAVALVLALAGIAFPMASSRIEPGVGSRRRPARAARTVAALGGTALASILLFHAAAAGRSPALLSVVPALVLLGAAAFRYGEDSWQTTRG